MTAKCFSNKYPSIGLYGKGSGRALYHTRFATFAKSGFACNTSQVANRETIHLGEWRIRNLYFIIAFLDTKLKVDARYFLNASLAIKLSYGSQHWSTA